MPERRYSRYRYEDVLVRLDHNNPIPFEGAQGRHLLHFKAVVNYSRSVRVSYRDKEYRAVVLARSSDWYHYSLNCTDSWHHSITAIIAGTHDSCVPLPVFAIDEQRVYSPKKARVESFSEAHFSEHLRKTQYGHNMLLGALMCNREDARERLMRLRDSTRYRILAKVKKLHMRRRGRPLFLG